MQRLKEGDIVSELHIESIHKATLAARSLASTSCPTSGPGRSIFYFINE